MHIINVAEAREQIAKILHAVEQGEEIIIQRYRKPIARITPYSEPAKPVFPDLSSFRAKQSGPVTTLTELRDEERY